MRDFLNKNLSWDSVFDLRYWIFACIFVILLALNINFSSIHSWNKFIPNTHPALQLGTERVVRGDEWVVNTPWQLSQSFNHYQTRNELIRHEGFNTILAQYLPAYNWENIGKPANWGFLLLDQSHGLSWYWLAKLLLLISSSCEITYLFTKNKSAALLGYYWLFTWRTVVVFKLYTGITYLCSVHNCMLLLSVSF